MEWEPSKGYSFSVFWRCSKVLGKKVIKLCGKHFLIDHFDWSFPQSLDLEPCLDWYPWSLRWFWVSDLVIVQESFHIQKPPKMKECPLSLGAILKGSRIVFHASIFRCENVSFRESCWTSTEKKSSGYGWMDAIFAGFGGARANHGWWTQACKEQQKTWCFLVENSRVEIERWGFIVRWSQFIWQFFTGPEISPVCEIYHHGSVESLQ